MASTALVTVLQAAGRAGVAVCPWGDPGIGKSALIHAAASADDVPSETVIGSLREPSDSAGLPVVGDDGVRMEPPAWAKRLKEAGAGFLFLDELSTATPAVQAAMLGVALERRVGELQLPRGVRIVAAANPPERAAGGWDLSPPLANRFLHVAYSPASTSRTSRRRTWSLAACRRGRRGRVPDLASRLCCRPSSRSP
jgi:MoxR-like ATPase